MSKFDKPKVTIDLEEYNLLKETENRQMENGLTENELSQAVSMLIKGFQNHYKPYIIVEQIEQKCGIVVKMALNAGNANDVNITFSKPKKQ